MLASLTSGFKVTTGVDIQRQKSVTSHLAHDLEAIHIPSHSHPTGPNSRIWILTLDMPVSMGDGKCYQILGQDKEGMVLVNSCQPALWEIVKDRGSGGKLVQCVSSLRRAGMWEHVFFCINSPTEASFQLWTSSFLAVLASHYSWCSGKKLLQSIKLQRTES